MNAASLHFLFNALEPRLRELADAEVGGDDETVTCPGCFTEVPADQLCEHDDTNTGPLCLARCCEIEHQVNYRRWIPDGAA